MVENNTALEDDDSFEQSTNIAYHVTIQEFATGTDALDASGVRIRPKLTAYSSFPSDKKPEISMQIVRTKPVVLDKEQLAKQYLSKLKPMLYGLDADSVDTLSAMYDKLSSEQKTKQLDQFFLDVQALQPSGNRVLDQYEIHRERISAFLAQHAVLNQKEAYNLLAGKKDKSVSRHMNKLIEEKQVFSLTLKGRGASTTGFPAFQFDANKGKVKPIVVKLLQILGEDYVNWDFAFWLEAYSHDLECSFLDAIDKEELHAPLLMLARSEVTDHEAKFYAAT